MSALLIIISAPSGAGKTTVLRQVMAEVENLVFSVSHTTRRPRAQEQHGRDYFFVVKDEFREMIRTGEFLEWAEVHGHYYGTAMQPLLESQTNGKDVLLDIDVQGAALIRGQGKLPGVHIFVAPPSVEELENRLRGRGTEDESTIRTRLQNSVDELGQSGAYDYVVVNDTVDNAVKMIGAIIYAERARQRRTLDGEPITPGVLT